MDLYTYDNFFLYIIQYYWTVFDDDFLALYNKLYNVTINEEYNVVYKLLKYNLTNLENFSTYVSFPYADIPITFHSSKNGLNRQ
mgnify:CR=1 FL=1